MYTLISKSRMIAFIPVCLLSLNSFSQEIVMYRGHTFEMSAPKIDTMVVVDPITGNEIWKTVRTDPSPITMNGKRIYRYELLYSDSSISKEIVPPGIDGNYLRKYLLKNLGEEFKNLPDGKYSLGSFNSIVIDDGGKVVYHENRGAALEDDYMLPAKINEAIKDDIKKRIDALLAEAPAQNPAALSGTPVPFAINTIAFGNPFVIKDHKLTEE